jgi:Protein of unknown function (DUF2917)
MTADRSEQMDEYIVQGSMGMPRGSTLRIDDGCGMLVYVWEGELWLTQDGSPKDHLMHAGEKFRLDRGGAAVAYSLRRSVVTLSSPKPGGYARRIGLTRAGAAAPLVLYEARRRWLPLPKWRPMAAWG